MTSHYDSVICAWIFTILSPLATVLNILIGLSIFNCHLLQTKCNYLIANIAAANALLSVCLMTKGIALNIAHFQNWRWANHQASILKTDIVSYCQTWQMIFHCATTAIILCTAVLALDRYLALFHSNHYSRLTQIQFDLIISITWSISASTGIISYFQYEQQQKEHCFATVELHDKYFYTQATLTFTLSLLAITFYSKIVQSIRQRLQRQLDQLATFSQTTTTAITRQQQSKTAASERELCYDEINQLVRKSIEIQREQIQKTKTIATLILTISILLLSPFGIIGPVVSILERCCLNRRLYIFEYISTLSLLHSLAIPLLLISKLNDYRIAMKILFKNIRNCFQSNRLPPIQFQKCTKFKLGG